MPRIFTRAVGSEQRIDERRDRRAFGQHQQAAQQQHHHQNGRKPVLLARPHERIELAEKRHLLHLPERRRYSLAMPAMSTSAWDAICNGTEMTLTPSEPPQRSSVRRLRFWPVLAAAACALFLSLVALV